ncbi:MAG TPA: glycosyltransferase family 4 protein [Gaiellaceae bacterium]|jgi:glycosyltransferase involved in cell wall biosynthesis
MAAISVHGIRRTARYPARAAGVRPRKVVVLTSSYPRHEGDFAGRFVADAVGELQRRGLEVEVVRVEVEHDGSGLVATIRRRPWRAVPLFFSLVRRLRAAARDADLVHAHWLASAAVARFGGKPFVVTLHGTGSAGALSDISLARRAPRLVRFLLRPARAVICVSEPLTEAMRAIGVEQARFIPNGVALPATTEREDESPFVLYAGRLAKEKGIPELIEAAQGLRLVVAGDGPLRGLVPQALGFVPHDELERLYDRAAVVVLPSHSEGLPLCVLEAMAHGRPVVATPVGGIPQLVENGRTGYLVPPGDPQALRFALERLLGDPALRARMGIAARDRVARLCSWERVTDQTLAAYTAA